MGIDRPKMEAQLARWRARIDQLAEQNLSTGGRANFDTLIHVDELKAMLAVAQSKYDEFAAAPDSTRVSLEAESINACRELAAAFKNPTPPH